MSHVLKETKVSEYKKLTWIEIVGLIVTVPAMLTAGLLSFLFMLWICSGMPGR